MRRTKLIALFFYACFVLLLLTFSRTEQYCPETVQEEPIINGLDNSALKIAIFQTSCENTTFTIGKVLSELIDAKILTYCSSTSFQMYKNYLAHQNNLANHDSASFIILQEEDVLMPTNCVNPKKTKSTRQQQFKEGLRILESLPITTKTTFVLIDDIFSKQNYLNEAEKNIKTKNIINMKKYLEKKRIDYFNATFESIFKTALVAESINDFLESKGKKQKDHYFVQHENKLIILQDSHLSLKPEEVKVIDAS